MRRLLLETRCGLYVGQRTAETRAEAPVVTSSAERRCAMCRREIWKSDYHGDDVWEWEQRQTGGRLLPQALLWRGNKMCVSCSLTGASADTGTAWEMLQQSWWGEELSGGKRERDELESWRWGRIRVNVPHKPRASTAHTRAAQGECSTGQRQGRQRSTQKRLHKVRRLSQIWSEQFRFGAFRLQSRKEH